MMLSITFLDVMNYSPNADNRNSTRIVVVKDRDALDYIGKTHTCILQRFNRGIVEPPDDDEIQAASNAFHNALTVLFLFGPKKFYFASADAYILAQNIAGANVDSESGVLTIDTSKFKKDSYQISCLAKILVTIKIGDEESTLKLAIFSWQNSLKVN